MRGFVPTQRISAFNRHVNQEGFMHDNSHWFNPHIAAENYKASGQNKLQAEVNAERWFKDGHITRRQFCDLMRAIDETYDSFRTRMVGALA
jgi:hypothetical protein